MLKLRILAACSAAIFLCVGCEPAERRPQAEVRIMLGDAAAEGIAALGLDVPVVGRAFFIVARDNEEMPHLGTGVTGNPLWGVDVRDYKAGDVAVIVDGGDTVSGYPFDSLDALPQGDYYVQAFLNVYTTFERADGHVIEAHMNSGAFQDPFKAPGNAYSDVRSWNGLFAFSGSPSHGIFSLAS
jgi:hypothetical protein